MRFKFTKDGHTRSIEFQHAPTWTALAARLQSIYNIPEDKIGISYIDADQDEITASSNEELQDFYQVSHQPGSVVKFNVWDLSISRGSPTALNGPATNANNLGQDNFEFVEHGWPRLDAFPISAFMESTGTSEAPHAYVEIVNSDISGFAKDDNDTSDAESVDQASTARQASLQGKGKQRSSSFGAASVTSLLGAEPSEKYPIHVLDHNSVLKPSAPEFPEQEAAVNLTGRPDDHSTPKVTTNDIKEEPESTAQSGTQGPAESAAAIEDPPLPPLDSIMENSNAGATLSHDIAALLTTVTNVVNAHPELSEGIRNIVNNARSGTYWSRHRAALTETVNELTNRSEDVRHAEEEAARSVNDALANFFRSLSVGPSTGNAEASTVRPRDSSGPPHRPLWGSRSSTSLNLRRPWSSNWHLPPWSFGGEPPIFGPQPGHFYPGHVPPPAHFHGPMPPPPPPPPPRSPPTAAGPPPPPPPPPPGVVPHEEVSGQSLPGSHRSRSPRQLPRSPHHGRHGYHGFGPHMGRRGGHHGHNVFIHPPPPPPPPPRPDEVLLHPLPGVPPPLGQTPPQIPPHMVGAGFVPPFPPESSAAPVFREPIPNTIQGPQMHTNTSSGPSRTYVNPFSGHEGDTEPSNEQQLRAQLEAAKMAYKEQKEAYRLARERRKKEKDVFNAAEDKSPSNNLVNEGPSQIVSQGRNGYPQLEMYSVPSPGPRRHHTHLGHGSSSRGGERKAENLNARAQSRIAKRLADMGFSEASYPDLPDKIKAQMPDNGAAITKEDEDDAVTTLLEELLARSARSPSGSGMRGAWH